MIRSVVAVLIFFLCFTVAQAQADKEALEKQRQELKKELEQTERLLQDNKARTKENLLQLNLITKKVILQDRLIDNINKDINILNNNIYLIQRDIYKYDRILDTLKKEYAKSMVYAYKNRNNYEFLNFIFSAANFNDAIKRITYLKSYRNYREIQGENILRTQLLRKKRVGELGDAKQVKNEVLQVQSKEMDELAKQQKEKDRIVAQLKKQGKDLNKQIAAKQKQLQKVNNAIAAAIKRAQEMAREEARKKAELEKKNATIVVSPTTTSKSTVKTKIAPKTEESVLLNAENVALNNSFERNKGSLPWPLDRGTILMHYGANKMPSGSVFVASSVTIAADLGTPVKAVFDGIVSTIQNVDDMQIVILQHGRYFTTYSNLNGVSVRKGQEVKTGQTIGRVAANFDGIGAIDFFMSNEKSNFDPENWLRRR